MQNYRSATAATASVISSRTCLCNYIYIYMCTNRYPCIYMCTALFFAQSRPFAPRATKRRVAKARDFDRCCLTPKIRYRTSRVRRTHRAPDHSGLYWRKKGALFQVGLPPRCPGGLPAASVCAARASSAAAASRRHWRHTLVPAE